MLVEIDHVTRKGICQEKWLLTWWKPHDCGFPLFNTIMFGIGYSHLYNQVVS